MLGFPCKKYFGIIYDNRAVPFHWICAIMPTFFRSTYPRDPRNIALATVKITKEREYDNTRWNTMPEWLSVGVKEKKIINVD